LVVATLTWPGDRGQASAQRVECTIFKDGFERDQYAWVLADKGGKFESAPGLNKMERERGRAFDLVAEPLPEPQKGYLAMSVKHLEPGILYRWRVATKGEKEWVPGRVVNREAPVCVADEKEGK
jgi:hypothetical protein